MPNNPSKPSRIQVHVKWSKPHPGWVKLNTDGSVFGDPKKAGGGGIIRNNEGDWVVSLGMFLVTLQSFGHLRKVS